MESPQSSDTSRAFLSDRLDKLLTTIGGFASVLVGIGYCYHFGYFRTFNATWLLRELSIPEIGFGSVPPVLLLTLYALTAQFLPRLFTSLSHASLLLDKLLIPSKWLLLPKLRERAAALLIIVGIVIDALAFNIPLTLLSVENRAGLMGSGFGLLAFGSAVLALAAFAASRSDSTQERARATILALWFIAVGLILTPAMFGVLVARIRVDSPNTADCAVVKGVAGTTKCEPLVYVGNERVYCFTPSNETRVAEIIPVEWSNVQAINVSVGAERVPPNTRPAADGNRILRGLRR